MSAAHKNEHEQSISLSELDQQITARIGQLGLAFSAVENRNAQLPNDTVGKIKLAYKLIELAELLGLADPGSEPALIRVETEPAEIPEIAAESGQTSPERPLIGLVNDFPVPPAVDLIKKPGVASGKPAVSEREEQPREQIPAEAEQVSEPALHKNARSFLRSLLGADVVADQAQAEAFVGVTIGIYSSLKSKRKHSEELLERQMQGIRLFVQGMPNEEVKDATKAVSRAAVQQIRTGFVHYLHHNGYADTRLQDMFDRFLVGEDISGDLAMQETDLPGVPAEAAMPEDTAPAVKPAAELPDSEPEADVANLDNPVISAEVETTDETWKELILETYAELLDPKTLESLHAVLDDRVDGATTIAHIQFRHFIGAYAQQREDGMMDTHVWDTLDRLVGYKSQGQKVQSVSEVSDGMDRIYQRRNTTFEDVMLEGFSVLAEQIKKYHDHAAGVPAQSVKPQAKITAGPAGGERNIDTELSRYLRKITEGTNISAPQVRLLEYHLTGTGNPQTNSGSFKEGLGIFSKRMRQLMDAMHRKQNHQGEVDSEVALMPSDQRLIIGLVGDPTNGVSYGNFASLYEKHRRTYATEDELRAEITHIFRKFARYVR